MKRCSCCFNTALTCHLVFFSFGQPAFSRTASSLQAGSCPGFLSVKSQLFLAAVLTWRFGLWASASVKHLETILNVKGAIKVT